MQALYYWGERHIWEQRLQGCFHLSTKPRARVYPFPLEEVIYQLLLHAKLEEPADSLHSLQQQWDQYRNEHPDFNVTIEKLIEEGWIDSFLGRWSLINRVRLEQAEAVEPGELQEILKFLAWLSAQSDEDRSALYLDDWAEQLTCMRQSFSEIPDDKWFVKHHILHEDYCHFCRMPYRENQDYFFRALARLWYQMGTPEQQEQWVEMAFQLGATAELLDYIPHEEQRALIALLVKRVRQGNVPSAQEEGNRISRNYMFETGKFQLDIPYENQLSNKDCVQNLTRAQREHWETSSYFWHRNSIRYFELAAVIDHISLVPDEVRGEVLVRLKQLHELGSLYLMQPFSPETIVQMLEYPETQFIALHTLVLLHDEQYRKGNTTAGDCILSWISYAVNRGMQQAPEPIKNLLAYLAEFAFRGSEHNQAERTLLSAVLRQINKVCMSRSDFLRSLAAQLIQCTEDANGLTWCRLMQLLGEWTQLLSEAIPKEQHSSSALLMLLYDRLRRYLQRILQTPFNRDAAFISPTLLEKSFWVEAYTLAGSGDRAWMHSPVLSWYAEKTLTSDDRFNARYQFRIGLSLLTTLAQAYETDKTVMKSFGSLFGYVLDADNQILSVEYIWSQSEYPELIRAIKFLQTERVSASQLWERIERFRLDELVLLIQFADDDNFRKKLLELLERKVHKPQEVEQFGSLKLMQYVLEQKIEALYDICEKYLQACMDRIEGKRLHNSLSDQCGRMQSYLWMLKGDYEKLFQRGHRYMQAVAYLDEGEHQNLDLAIQLWKQIAEEGDTQSGHLNWLLSYLRKLAKTPEECVAVRRELYQEIEQLRNKIETHYFASWEESAKLGYAERIVYFEVLCGKDEDEVIQKTAKELQLSTEILLRTVKSEPNDDTPEEKLPVPYSSMTPFSTDQITCALQQFQSLSLKRKAECYFGSKGVSAQEDPEITLILFEVLRALYHLSNYGDKLVSGDALNEDRCTQLFRELFNLNGAEWWQVASNDQQQSGSTGNILKSGVPASAEVDLLIKTDGYTCMILEAVVLNHMDRTQIKEHIGKLIGNNIANKPMVLLVYGNSSQYVPLCSNLKTYLCTEFSESAEELEVKIEPFVEFEQSRFYCEEYNSAFRELTRDALVTCVCHNGGQDIPLVVLCADIAKRGHTEIGKKARMKSTE